MESTRSEDKTITTACFSKEFVLATSNVKIYNLSQLLELTPSELLSIPDFTFSMLCEYRSFLREHNLEQ